MATTIVHAGLDAWAIQEGNLPELRVGQCVRLALVFAPRHVEPARRRARKLVHLGSCCYHMVGRVHFGNAGAWSLDAGWRFRGDGRPAGFIDSLDWIQAEGVLHVDPWSQAKPPRIDARGVGPQEYIVRGIVRDTAFFRQLRLSENRAIEPGRQSQSLVEFLAAYHDDDKTMPVESTTATLDDGGGHYVLALEPAMLTSEASAGA